LQRAIELIREGQEAIKNSITENLIVNETTANHKLAAAITLLLLARTKLHDVPPSVDKTE